MDAIVVQMIKRRNNENISVPKLSEILKIPQGRIYKWEQDKGNPKGGDIEKIKKWLDNVPNVPHETQNTLEEAGIDYSQPIINVVLNLSYIGKKHADSMDKMAATNQRNTEIIAALVASILPNSKFAQKLAASLSDLHTGDGMPVEDFLPKNTDADHSKEKQSGKPAVKGK